MDYSWLARLEEKLEDLLQEQEPITTPKNMRREKPCSCGVKVRTFDSQTTHKYVRRRKECTKCGKRWTTLEIPASLFA